MHFVKNDVQRLNSVEVVNYCLWKISRILRISRKSLRQFKKNKNPKTIFCRFLLQL